MYSMRPLSRQHEHSTFFLPEGTLDLHINKNSGKACQNSVITHPCVQRTHKCHVAVIAVTT